MLKRIGAIVMTLALVVGTIGAVPYESKAAEYQGQLSVKDAQIVTTNNNCIYLKGTDTYLAGNGEDWESPSAILQADVNDVSSGIWLNDTKQSGAFMKKYDGSLNRYYVQDFGLASGGDIVTVKGTFHSSDGQASVVIQESKFQWNGSQWIDYVAGTTYRETLTFQSGDSNHVYFTYKATDADGEVMPDLNWELALIPLDSESGVYLNGNKLENGYMKKVPGETWYTGELGATTGDVLTIKGTFGYSENGNSVTIQEIVLQWNGNTWVEEKNIAEFSGALAVQGAQITTTNNACIYLKGTDSYLSGGEEDWEAPSAILQADSSDDASGVWVNDVKKTGAVLIKYCGAENWYYIKEFGSISNGDIVTIKGDFVSQDDNAKIVYAESKFQWDGIRWIDYVERVVGNDYKETLSFMSGDAAHLYFLPQPTEDDGELMPDENWELALYPIDDASGLFINGEKFVGGYMKKVDGGNWYTGELDMKAGDKLEIKGSFGYSEHGHTVCFETICLIWDGLSWAEEFDSSSVPCKDITLNKLHNVSGFSTDQNQWKFYITLDGKIPGEIDITQFQGVEVDINGTVYKMQGAHSHDDTFYLGISGDIVPQFPEDNVKITIKAGRYVTTDKTTGVNIKKDFSIYVTKYGVSEKAFLKPYVPNEKNVQTSIDRDRAWGGNENGIYLLTEDKFPVDETWATLIRAVAYDEKSGIFYNGQKIESILKKYEDGRIYIDLLGAGITAKDKDKVTIKGTFYLDDYAVSYKEYTLYYNGKAWNTTYFKQKVKYVNITGQSIHQVSWFDEPTKQWKVYIIVDGKLPGSQDAMSFDGLEIVVNGKKLDTLTHHSHEGCLYFGIPEEYLSKNVKDGIKITVKAGKALAANRIEGIKWTKDFSFYTYMGSLTADKPTKNTNYQDITLVNTPSVLRYNKEAQRWNLFIKTSVEIETEHATQYLKFPVYLNGKKEELTVAKEHEYLFIWLPEDILSEHAGPTTLTIKKGSTGVANAGRNGIRIENDFSLYLYNGVWSIFEFDEKICTETKISGVQNTEYAEGADGVNHWNIYLWADIKIPGTAWYEQYMDFTLYFNGKEIQAQLAKAYSSNSRLLHFPLQEALTGKVKEGDRITIKPHTATCGGYEIEFKDTFELIYQDGVWSQYVKSKAKEPKDEKSLWEMARFDEAYIPFTERGTVTFSGSDKYNKILSTEDLMDYSVSFQSTKLTDNTATPGVSVILRGNAIDEETEISTNTLYGYVVQFKMESEAIDEENVRWIGCVSIWKNGRKDGLVDAYRIAYAREKDNPFFWFNKQYEYEFSIYNVTDTCVCITVKVNGKPVIRCFDEASDDPMDPAVNPGKFGVFAEDTCTIYDDIYEVDKVLATATECKVGDGVWMAGSYPYVLEKTTFTVEEEGAKVSNGVFKASEPGNYTVSCTYDGKTLEPITIAVSPDETAAVEPIVTKETFDWLPLGIGAVVVVVLGGIGAVLIAKGKRKKKA